MSSGSATLPIRMHVPPSDPLRDVFTEEVLAALHARPSKSEYLEHRLAVLGVRAPFLRAAKAAWEAYLTAAFALGLFSEPYGADLRARLTGTDDDAFRSAMAECLAGWLLAGKLKLAISPRPEGRRGRPLEYLIAHEGGDIRVEVKAPHHAIPANGVWSGDDSDLLAAALKSANEQFDAGVRNLLVVVPKFRIPVHHDRGQITSAFYGQPVMTFPVDLSEGKAVGPVTTEFAPDGRFLARRTPTGRPIKPDGMPAFTRVGAILCVEVVRQPGRLPWMDHRVLIAHNPYAQNPIPREIWGTIPQCLHVAGEMAWNDGGKAL